MTAISPARLKDAERIARAFMVLILLTAGSSKLFSGGGFVSYYAGLFQAEGLRLQMPPGLVRAYLSAIPLIELGLGLALIVPKLRQVALLGWFAFMASLLFGHYVLQEWSAVNQMLDYVFLGLICYLLPYHKGPIARDTDA